MTGAATYLLDSDLTQTFASMIRLQLLQISLALWDLGSQHILQRLCNLLQLAPCDESSASSQDANAYLRQGSGDNLRTLFQTGKKRIWNQASVELIKSRVLPWLGGARRFGECSTFAN